MNPEHPDDDPQYWTTGNLHMFMLGPPIMTSILFAFYAISSSYGNIFTEEVMNYVTISECNVVLLEAWKIIEFKMQFLDVQVRLLNKYLAGSEDAIEPEPCASTSSPKSAKSSAVSPDSSRPAERQNTMTVEEFDAARAKPSAFSASARQPPARLYDPPLRNIFSRQPHGQTNQKTQ